MNTVPVQVFECDITNLEQARLSRDIAGFQRLSVIEQWHYIERTWPLPLCAPLVSSDEFQQFVSRLEVARDRLNSLASLSDTVQGQAEAAAADKVSGRKGRADQTRLANIAASTACLAAEAQACLEQTRRLESGVVSLLGQAKLALRLRLVRDFNRLASLVPLAATQLEKVADASDRAWEVEKALICFRLLCLCIEAEADGASTLCQRLDSLSGALPQDIKAYVSSGTAQRSQIIDVTGDVFVKDALALVAFQSQMASLWPDGAPDFVGALLPSSLCSD